MAKRILFGIFAAFTLIILIAGCGSIQNKDSTSTGDFKRGPTGLVMNFIPNKILLAIITLF